MGKDIFHHPRLLQALSNLALDTSRDGAVTASLGNLCQGLPTLTGKNFFLISNPTLLCQFEAIPPCPVPPGPCKQSLSIFPGAALQRFSLECFESLKEFLSSKFYSLCFKLQELVPKNHEEQGKDKGILFCAGATVMMMFWLKLLSAENPPSKNPPELDVQVVNPLSWLRKIILKPGF
ncbi:hypothetical protein WISP_41664 [Willisornis vidua]|uniref:Uncharacterized protein n=1 Tax=Willisornis vidua TaxID=1566151 RepID=A0ABQ9DHD6_9PASS|nr:hypothetical protein WISP_41664 [Willisornis vidua]